MTMSTVTAVIVWLAFLAGCVTAVVGVRVGHGESSVVALLNWGAATLVLQLAAACIAFVHARADRDPDPEELPAADGAARRLQDPERPLGK